MTTKFIKYYESNIKTWKELILNIKAHVYDL